ncbi:TniB family NTP-binding protein (plasmid) [Streptomyces sp. NBC_00536]|uniref:TniB family NTP-binding protein n=1 Tax=Streptomyces sp. NBC_00536 TaxID=2975769 RepID=UPI002E813D80|nr:TniB family NTP-binding protein [Streptomyces sp. NBC_00536]WUC76882.1 TniB family NTP-binding protein [Streptomyces sp. NBC_00536]WUC83515.1 TniB family NTP-binding protein [Streptomyces sp. NBC_00536]WUC84073.1 TniB family NTP-binding protein [Streptomyces sp. NBC_00536]
MKATVESQKNREQRLQMQMRATPMRPLNLLYRSGWDEFVREEVNRPHDSLAPGADALADSEEVRAARIAYHRHMRMVLTTPMEKVINEVAQAVHLNSGRRDGLLDRVIDGPHGTGKSALLRAVGRRVQQDVEKGQRGHDANVVPVVHITAPDEAESKTAWVWEIACFLGLNPAPKNKTELLDWRKHPDLSQPVNYVLEVVQTRLLLVDGLDTATPDQLICVLPYFDYLRNKLGITTIFCGTGANARIHQARHRADNQVRVHTAPLRAAEAPRGMPDTAAYRSPGLPVAWMLPLPLDKDDPETFRRVLAGFQEDLSLYKLDDHALTRHATQLHAITDGHIALLSQLICTAAVQAIVSGTENITLADLRAINIRAR